VKVFDGFRLGSDSALSDAEVLAAKKLAVDTRLEAHARGLNQFRKYVELPNGGYAYSLKAGDYLNVHVVPGARPKEEDEQQVEFAIPDFGSGWVVGGIIIPTRVNGVGPEIDMTDFRATTLAAIRLGTTATKVRGPRYALEPSDERSDLRNPNEPPRFSQYVYLRPAMYSGKMQKVAQLVLGYGKPKKPNVFSPFARTVARAAGLTEATDEINDAFRNGVPIKYDNRFYRTHGITVDPTGKWWIIEISGRGMHAMPMPFWPGTTLAAFKDRAELIDSEIYNAIAEFGGLPSGDSLPLGDALFNCMKRAGLIKELAPASRLTNFYRLSPFSSSMGWAINASGTEAHNVAYEYDDNGIPYSEYWAASFSIGSTIAPQNEDHPDLPALRTKLNGATAPSAKYKEYVISKLPYLSNSELLNLGRSVLTAQEAFDACDGIEISRVNGIGNVAMVKRATYWYPSINYSMMKVHEPLIGGLLSVDMRRLGYQTTDNVPTVMDAIMNVHFIDDEIKYTYFYWDRTTEYVNEDENNFEPCMLAGNYYQYLRSGNSAVPPLMYTTDVDVRRRLSPTETEQTITSRKLDAIIEWHSLDPAFLSHGVGYRDHYWEKKFTYETTYDRARGAFVIIPGGVRHGSLILTSESRSGMLKGTQYTLVSRTDTWSYWGRVLWANRDVMEQLGYLPIQAVIYPDGPLGDCPDRFKFKVGGEPAYEPTECSYMYDYGPWAVRCQEVPPGNVPQQAPTVPASTTENDFDPYSSWEVTLDLEALEKPEVVVRDDNRANRWGSTILWVEASPNKFGDVQRCYVTTNCLGDGNALVADTGPNGYGPGVSRGAPIDEDIRKHSACFVGVVNGY
jgi:hypothetical protein